MKALTIAVIGGSTYTPELIEGFVRYFDELPVGRIVVAQMRIGGLVARALDEQIPVMLLVTETIIRRTDAQVIGLCNVPINMQISSAKFLDAPTERVELQYVGLNHLTREVLEMHWGSAGGHVDAEFLRALGLIPNYYLRYFAHPDRILREQLTAEETAVMALFTHPLVPSWEVAAHEAYLPQCA